MVASAIESDFKKKVCNEVQLVAEGQDRFRVATPFRFDDGDHLAIVLRKRGPRWVLTDEGHTFMHLSYRLDMADLEKGTRKKVIDQALSEFNVTLDAGELLLPVQNGSYGDALFSYVQALMRISDVTYLNREFVKTTFMEDFQRTISLAVPDQSRLAFNWHDTTNDPDAKYPVDCRVQGKDRPLFVFGIQGDDKCSLATIVILHHQTLGTSFNSLAVFRDQEAIHRKNLARLSDVVDRQFSSLDPNKAKISKFLREWTAV
jgi:hypothetical protein